MNVSRVIIFYKPRLYTDLFTRLFQCLDTVEVVDINCPDVPADLWQVDGGNGIDVIVCSLDEEGGPDLEYLPARLPDAKLVAFSPVGDSGFRRLPGSSEWEEVRPFGLRQLVKEVLGGRNRPEDTRPVKKEPTQPLRSLPAA